MAGVSLGSALDAEPNHLRLSVEQEVSQLDALRAEAVDFRAIDCAKK